MTRSATTSPSSGLLELHSLAQTLGQQAGELIVAGRDRAITDIATKSDPTDVVTAMDQAAEALLRERLAELRPDDGVHGEEHPEQPGTSGVRWIIDPIDGTVNYLYGLPDFSVSIGVEVDGELSAGVVYKPRTGDMFHAVTGQGAFCNRSRLQCANPPSLSLTLLATGFGYLPERRRAQGAVVAAMLAQVRDIRRIGSAALDLCNVAAGRVDAYYEWGTHIWDWAAGSVIAREAGARVLLPRDDEGLVIAAAPGIADDLAAALRAQIDPAWGVPD